MDLTTTYLGFQLPHPFVPGAGPLADDLASVRRLEDAGAPMIVLRSLFEEQIVSEQMATHRATEEPAESFAEATSYLPYRPDFVMGPHEYLEHLRRVRQAVSVPVVASINGTTLGGWLEYAQLMQEAGANALELNVYGIATDVARRAESIEQETIEMVRLVKRELTIPVAVKLSPFYTSLANLALRLDRAGVDAMILFNRFYQPDIDIEELEVRPHLQLSDSSELLLRLRWLAILSGRIHADLVLTGGVHTAADAVKAIMCGACTVQMVSALLERGPEYLLVIRDEVSRWLTDHEYESLRQMRGSMSLQKCPAPKAFERANYMQILQSWQT